MTANEMRYYFLILYDKLANLAAPPYEDNELSKILTDAQEKYIKSHYHPRGNKYQEGFEFTEKRRKDLSYLTKNYNIDSSIGTITDQTGTLPYGMFWILPDDYLWAIEEHCEINITSDCTIIPPIWKNPILDVPAWEDIGSDQYKTRSVKPVKPIKVPVFPGGYDYKIVPVKPITHDEYIVNIDNPFKQPTYKDEGLVWRIDYTKSPTYMTTVSNRHELITNKDFMVVRYNSRYIKRPDAIVVDTVNILNQVNCKLDESTHLEIVDIAVRIASGITDPNTYKLKDIQVQTSE